MILIYGKPGCTFCEQARALCESRGYAYEYRTLDVDYTKQQLLETFPLAKTVPQIVVNGLKVGGFTDFTKYIEDTNYTGTGHTL